MGWDLEIGFLDKIVMNKNINDQDKLIGQGIVFGLKACLLGVLDPIDFMLSGRNGHNKELKSLSLRNYILGPIEYFGFYYFAKWYFESQGVEFRWWSLATLPAFGVVMMLILWVFHKGISTFGIKLVWILMGLIFLPALVGIVWLFLQ